MVCLNKINFIIKKSVISYEEQKTSIGINMYSSCVPGMRLSSLWELIYLRPTYLSMLSACYRRGSNGLEKLRNLSEVTQLVCGRQNSTSEPILIDTMKTFRRMNSIYIPHYILGTVSGRLIIFCSLISFLNFKIKLCKIL